MWAEQLYARMSRIYNVVYSLTSSTSAFYRAADKAATKDSTSHEINRIKIITLHTYILMYMLIVDTTL